MSTASSLEIKTIYSASGRGRRKPARVVSVGPGTRTLPWLILGVFNLLAAGGLSYVTWWRVDPFIYDVFTWKTPLPGVDADQAVAQMFPNLTAAVERAPPATAEENPADAPKYVGKTATVIIGTTAYAWLTLAVIASCALALSAGAALARGGGVWLRRVGAVLAVAGLLVLGAAVYRVLSEHGLQYTPRQLRLGMTALALLVAPVGLAIGRGSRGLARLAAITLILSALGTAVALHLGGHCDAVSPEHSALPFVFLAFILHSLYGWFLLLATHRLPR